MALLDANVLYPATLRDVILTITEAGVCQIRWSPDILDEMERNLAQRAKAPTPSVAAAGAHYVRGQMEIAFPDAMVERASYEALIPSMANDKKDRHVLAAAVAGRADVLVTLNLRDFPDESCQPYGIEVQHPDIFLVHQFDLLRDDILHILADLSEDRRPPMDTITGILESLRALTPQFCEMALGHLQSGN